MPDTTVQKKKQKRQYFRLPIITVPERCPLCWKDLRPSKIQVVLYDALNDKASSHAHKVGYCSDCHLPFVTESEAKAIEQDYPGLHVERIRQVHMSAESLTKQVGSPAIPIRNLPKGGVLYVGPLKAHACGTSRMSTYKALLHDEEGIGMDIAVDVHACAECGKTVMEPYDANQAMKRCPDYLYIDDAYSWQDIYPDKKQLYMLNINQYTKDTCPACMGRLVEKDMLFKLDRLPKLIEKKLKQCTSCQASFGRCTSFEGKPYRLYKLSREYFKEEPFRNGMKVQALGAGDFLTRHSLSGCQSQAHSLEDITARIKIAAPDGSVSDYDAPAVRCDTCGRLFILESEYQKLIRKGAPLCPIVENEFWRKAPDRAAAWGPSDARGSILYIHGYNVSAQSDLTAKQRHRVLDALVHDGACTRGQIAAHLDMLIRRAEGQPILQNALRKWQSDRAYVAGLEQDAEVYRANSIIRARYRTKAPAQAQEGERDA